MSAGGAEFDAELAGTSGPLSSLTFEEILAALEQVTGRMASGELGIEAATDLYEQAEMLYAAARSRLEAVEDRVSRLGLGAPPSP
jgi:exodeoxyribonuclease VII small subunit